MKARQKLLPKIRKKFSLILTSSLIPVGAEGKETEICLNKNNSKRAYQLVKYLTSEKQGRSSSIQDRSGKCLIEEQESQQMDRILLRTVHP